MRHIQSDIIRRRVIWIALTVLVIAAISGAAVLAQFTMSHRARRVIAANGDSEQLFSSNYMQEQLIARTKYTETAGDAMAEITVCNYAQGNNSVYYDTTITYSLSGRIVQLENGVAVTPTGDVPAVTISKQGNTNGTSLTLTTASQNLFSAQTLAQGSARMDVYQLSFPASFRESGYYVELVAEPTALDLNRISVWLNLQQFLADVHNDWGKSLVDQVTNDNIGQFSGYNFRISGSGAGTVTLGWNKDLLEISKVFLENELGLTSEQVNTALSSGSVTIPVNSEVKNYIDIQFYRKNGAVPESLAALKAAVTCVYAATPTPTPTPIPTPEP